MIIKKEHTLLLSAFVAFFIVIQVKSMNNVDILIRDQKSNVFQEILILKNQNEDLKHEIIDLEKTLEQLDDQSSALEAIENEINKYKKLSGEEAIYGTGLAISLNSSIDTPWIVDLTNELFNSGAQAVSINGIRITNYTSGLDTIPSGQILLNGSTLSAPYIFEAIGEPEVLLNILRLEDSILFRMTEVFPELKIDMIKKEFIEMK